MKRLAAAAFGLFLCLAVLALAELIARRIFSEPPRYDRAAVERQPFIAPSDPSGDAPTRIKLNLPVKNERPTRWVQDIPALSTSSDYIRYDSVTGSRLIPGSYERAPGITYTIDAESRRIVPHQGKSGIPVLFFGCSFVFGEGLSDDQTLPARFQRAHPEIRAYNYGVTGWGPANFLRQAGSEDFAQDIPDLKKGLAVYVWIDNHLDRLMGRLSLYRVWKAWPGSLPYYRLKDDRLEDHGMISDRWSDMLFRFLAWTRLSSVLGIELPWRNEDDELRLAAKVLASARDRLGIPLIVVIHPGAQTAPKLIPFLDQAGIYSLNLASVDPRDYTALPPYLPDSHPSGSLNRLIATQIPSNPKDLRPNSH